MLSILLSFFIDLPVKTGLGVIGVIPRGYVLGNSAHWEKLLSKLSFSHKVCVYSIPAPRVPDMSQFSAVATDAFIIAVIRLEIRNVGINFVKMCFLSSLLRWYINLSVRLFSYFSFALTYSIALMVSKKKDYEPRVNQVRITVNANVRCCKYIKT